MHQRYRTRKSLGVGLPTSDLQPYRCTNLSLDKQAKKAVGGTAVLRWRPFFPLQVLLVLLFLCPTNHPRSDLQSSSFQPPGLPLHYTLGNLDVL